MLKPLLFTLSAGFFFTGCNIKGSSSHDLDMLTGEPWKYQQAGLNSHEDGGSFDALDPRIAGCERDNTVIFKEDGTGMLQEGKVKCKVTDPDNLPFIWSFQNNDSTIYFQDQYYKVQELSKKRFAIYADQNFGGVNTRYTIIFIR